MLRRGQQSEINGESRVGPSPGSMASRRIGGWSRLEAIITTSMVAAFCPPILWDRFPWARRYSLAFMEKEQSCVA